MHSSAAIAQTNLERDRHMGLGSEWLLGSL